MYVKWARDSLDRCWIQSDCIVCFTRERGSCDALAEGEGLLKDDVSRGCRHRNGSYCLCQQNM